MNHAAGLPFAHELARSFSIEHEVVIVGNSKIELIRPRSADELIDEEQFRADERMPYWAELWPSARILAQELLENPAEGELLELGCGLGLVTIAGILAGSTVLATDYEPAALAFTRANSLINTGREASTVLLDWREIPRDFPRFDRIVAADVLYEVRYGPILAAALARLLRANGEAIIADPGRLSTPRFLEVLPKAGLAVVDAAVMPYEDGRVRQKITLYRIVRR